MEVGQGHYVKATAIITDDFFKFSHIFSRSVDQIVTRLVVITCDENIGICLSAAYSLSIV